MFRMECWSCLGGPKTVRVRWANGKSARSQLTSRVRSFSSSASLPLVPACKVPSPLRSAVRRLLVPRVWFQCSLNLCIAQWLAKAKGRTMSPLERASLTLKAQSPFSLVSSTYYDNYRYLVMQGRNVAAMDKRGARLLTSPFLSSSRI